MVMGMEFEMLIRWDERKVGNWVELRWKNA